MTMIRQLYGRYYDIAQLFVTPADQGHAGVARTRTYLILTLKGVVRQARDVNAVYREVSNFIAGLVQTQPGDYLVADRVDLLLEAHRTAAARKVELRDVTRPHSSVGNLMNHLLALRPRPVSPSKYVLHWPFVPTPPHLPRHFQANADEDYQLEYLLNARERRGLRFVCRLYSQRFGRCARQDRNLFVHLGDNPQKYLCWSAVSNSIPTFRRGSGRMFHPATGVWMTPRDKLAALGMPVTPGTSCSMGVPILPVADISRASSIAGNSFHFATAAVVQLVALTCYRDCSI